MGHIRFIALLIVIGFHSASAQTWTPLGSGVGAQVNALTVFNSELYAAGLFTTAGGNPANRVAKWNGTTWSALGAGTAFPANALAVYNGELYAGYYTGTSYKWNGSSWVTVGPGGVNDIFAMTVYNGELITGGTNQINRFNGSTWGTAIPVTGGTAVNGPHVSSFAIYNGELYAGGNFGSINGVSANSIAKWNGTSWSPLGTGIVGGALLKVAAMTVYNGNLYVAGNFTTAGGVASPMIAKWNGTTWSAVGAGLNGPVSALQVHNGNLYVGGSFQFADPYNVQNMAMWNGTAWVPFGPGTDNTVRALAEFGGQLIAGGSFISAGGNPANFIAGFTQCTAPPAQPGAITGNDTTCSGTNQVYNLPFVNGMSYTWTLPVGWTGSSTSNQITGVAAGSGSGTISVSAINACGASTPSTMAILQFPSPTASVTASGPLTFCQGGSVILTTPGTGGNSFQWRKNSNSISGATANSYTVTTAGNYVVRVSNGVCTTTSSSSVVVVHPLPSTPTFTISGNDLSATGGFTGYQWFRNGTAVSGATTAQYTVTQSGNYYVVVTDNNGCTAQSAAQFVTAVGINDLSASETVQLFPNPSNGIFTLRCKNSSNGTVGFEVRDLSGKLVHTANISATGHLVDKTINLSYLPAGVYSVRVITNDQSTVHSMIKK